MDHDFTEDVRQKAMHKWKWRNPYFVGFLVFLHPIFMLLSSVPAAFVCIAIWFAVVPLDGMPLGMGLLLSAAFGFYGYYNTRWKNAAIEKWKYGLSGTGNVNPKKLGLEPIQDQ